MKFNIYKSIAVCSLVALAGCHDFEEMNTNPYQPGYIPEATENVSPNGYDIDYQLSEKALASLKERESGIGSTLSMTGHGIITKQQRILPMIFMLDILGIM